MFTRLRRLIDRLLGRARGTTRESGPLAKGPARPQPGGAGLAGPDGPPTDWVSRVAGRPTDAGSWLCERLRSLPDERRPRPRKDRDRDRER